MPLPSNKYNKNRYTRHPLWHWVGRPLFRRLAYVATAVLSVVSIIPLSLKMLWNLCNFKFKAAAKNFLAVIVAPLGMVLISIASIFFPSKVGGYLVKWGVLPAAQCKKKEKPRIKEFLDSRNGASIYQLFFNPNGSAVIPGDNEKAVFKIKYFNYPGTFLFPKIKDNNNSKNLKDLKCTSPDSVVRLVNAGIKQVYELKGKKDWSWVSNKLHFYGHSLGGGVALQVAAHFKVEHDVDINVFCDRTFSSIKDVAAEWINRLTGLPQSYGRILASTVLFAAGNWNLDSMAAVKKLTPKFLKYVNVGHINQEEEEDNLKWFEKLFKEDADKIILNGSTLADGIEASEYADLKKRGRLVVGKKRTFSSTEEENDYHARNTFESMMLFCGRRVGYDPKILFRGFKHLPDFYQKLERGHEVYCQKRNGYLDDSHATFAVAPASHMDSLKRLFVKNEKDPSSCSNVSAFSFFYQDLLDQASSAHGATFSRTGRRNSG